MLETRKMLMQRRFSLRKYVLKKNKLKIFDPFLIEYQNMLNSGYDII